MRSTLSIFIKALATFFGKRRLESLLVFFAKEIKVNLHVHGLVQIGAVDGFDAELNGEFFFLEKILPDLLQRERNAVFFDVGANIGNYSLRLAKIFTKAKIFSFEPVKSTYQSLIGNIQNTTVKAFNFGLSNTRGNLQLYNGLDTENSEITSAYKDAFLELFDQNKVIAISVVMNTLDHFCFENHISQIDFLKIDVEGHELSVLEGAKQMLIENHIKVIQFEFNTHNTYSRVFLRDFYKILPQFDFYRLSKKGLITLGDYTPINEVFTPQNLIAVNKDLPTKINTAYISRLE